jgi:hypothetical protein
MISSEQSRSNKRTKQQSTKTNNDVKNWRFCLFSDQSYSEQLGAFRLQTSKDRVCNLCVLCHALHLSNLLIANKV